MKIVCVVGARPNFMKIAPLMWEMRRRAGVEPYLVHTGQHYDERMSKLFFQELKKFNEAFAAGEVQRAVKATPEEIADQIMLAGTPEDWVRWLTETYAPAGLNHALVSFTDPFTLRAWAGIEVEGLPDLGEQIRLVGEHVLPAISSL